MAAAFHWHAKGTALYFDTAFYLAMSGTMHTVVTKPLCAAFLCMRSLSRCMHCSPHTVRCCAHTAAPIYHHHSTRTAVSCIAQVTRR
jgi:hypothetical protein